jgi:hypothetical protein
VDEKRLRSADETNTMHNHRLTLAATTLLALVAAAPSPAPDFAENFDAADLGKPRKEFLLYAGAFEVKDGGGGNKVLELPGEPLESLGAMFGPAEHNAIDVRAKVWAATTGKRYPEFGVGAADISGYRLLLLPRQKRLVIRKADVEVASAPYDAWKTETWTNFRLTVEPAGAAWRVTGKAWPAEAEESKAATVVLEEKDKPSVGRGSIWGMPFSGKPIRYDDIEVRVGK